MATAPRRAITAALVSLGFLLLPATGCLFIYERSVDRSGDVVLKGKLEAAEEGVTTREDVLEAFGPPRQALKLEGGREVLIYVVETRTDVQMGVLLLFLWQDDLTTTTRHSFEFQDGVLVRQWTEQMP
ncbi:MAG: hypothetical protein PVJ27_01830 [Candidatus Brocadiaceae bacterium]|jgi:hypothetical protein